MLFETLKTRGAQAGLLHTDIEYASYALAAYLDEVIQHSDWSGKQEWAAAPLQRTLFGETRAGAIFFDKLTEVRRSSPVAVHTFYTCLALGFQGEYRLRGGDEIKQLLGDLRRELRIRVAKQLSLHGRRPDDRGTRTSQLPYALLALVFVGLAIGCAIGLYFFLGSTMDQATEALVKLGRG